MSWTQNFNTTAILTSKNPEVFLTIQLSNDDIEATHWIMPVLDGTLGRGILYVNGLDINDYLNPSLGYALELSDPNRREATFHVYTPAKYNFEKSLSFNIWDSSNLSLSVDSTSDTIEIRNRPYIIKDGVFNSYETDNVLVDDEASYLILRTNPKYTGNIKIIVDEKNNIYLDTFKVSDILSNKKYRHQIVSGKSILSGDIRNIFSSLPLGELYRVDVDDTFNIGIPKTDIKDQFNTTYNYGARLLKDELYPEDNGILAPLWINSQIPDYFAVFRLNGLYNPETYNDDSLNNLAFKYLENSTIIKSWSLKNDESLGEYLNSHLIDATKVQAPVFLSLTDINAIESDPNTWYGIAVDKGVVTGRSETTYIFNQKSQNFTDLNAFVSQGFERNSLVSSNLLNLEFLFNDEDVSLYSMSRYFGLYLTENTLYNVAYYANEPNVPGNIISLDGKDLNEFIDSSVFDINGNIISEYSNRLFVINDGIQLKRLSNISQINGTNNSYISKPYKNIFNTPIEQITLNPFVLINLNNKLEQGEHLRILNTVQNSVWEICGLDCSTYAPKYVTFTETENGYPNVYRTVFDTNGDIAYQAKEIADAFDLFAKYPNAPFRTGVYGKDWVSIILNDDVIKTDWYFQRITASTMNNSNIPNYGSPIDGFNTSSKFEDISFFGRFTPDASYFFRITYDASYGPIDYEFFGDRQYFTIPFINCGSSYVYSFNSSLNILDKFEDTTLYQGVDKWYRKILSMRVSDKDWLHVKDPTHISDKVIILSSNPIQTVSGQFNAFSLHPINISLMGINPVKDIDFTVYDNSLGFTSEYYYNREDDIDTYDLKIDELSNCILDIPASYEVKVGRGNFTQNGSTFIYDVSTTFNTFDTSIYIDASIGTTITYAIIDGLHEYKGYKPIGSSTCAFEEHLNDYYQSNTLLKYGLTVPLVSKWVGLGSDSRNNPLRLMLTANKLDVSTNFIPTDSEFTQEISYPSFKYLNPGDKAWESYVFYDVNDLILDHDSSLYFTVKEMMFNNPYVDYFSKLMYTNNNVDSIKSRSSVCYYNQYKNTIDTLLLGVSYSFKVENAAKNSVDIKNYDKFRFSLITTSSKNTTNKRPIEVIINENTKTILMIWYQGNDELNYNKRYSSFLPGKSLLDASSNGFVTGLIEKNYSFVKSPYYINSSTIQKSIVKQYGVDPYSTSPYAQFNKNLGGFNSVYDTWGANVIFKNVLMSDINKQYQTFAQYVDYTYMNNSNTYGNYVINYAYNYNSNKNWYINNTTNLTTLIYFLSPTFTHVMYYIIRGDKLYTSYDFGSSINPISIKINSPKSYADMQIYNGWFKPKFNNILDFKENEELELINTVKKDFTFANTNLHSYNNINQFWYNKVVSTVTSSNILEGNAISYLEDYNVFKSLWDADYYIKDNAKIDGYYSPDELPAFFGSKLPKFPNEIKLEQWDFTTLVFYPLSETELVLSYNLTRAILSLFKTNNDFLKNWSNFTDTDNVIDSYVKNTVLSYYDISQPKIKVNCYYKPFNGFYDAYYLDNDFILDDKQNFNGQVVYENDEYIYRIIIPKNGKFTYFNSFTLTEK